MKSDPTARKYRRVPRAKIRPLGVDEDASKLIVSPERMFDEGE